VTRTEAAKGDQQAIRRMAASQSSASNQQAQQPAGSKGGLDIEA
jgi:hypothetical protein